MAKLLKKADVKVCRMYQQKGTNVYILKDEMKAMLALLGEVAYCLYAYYRTGFFSEAADFDDENVAEDLGWPVSKVQKYRLLLEANGVFLKVRYGTKQNGITKVLIGLDIVALHNAGLPVEVTDSKAFKELKKQFNIETTADLIANAERIMAAYENNISK